jgi:hypothetical protein
MNKDIKDKAKEYLKEERRLQNSGEALIDSLY